MGGPHTAVFLPSLENEGGVELKAKWLQKAVNHEIMGCYVLTELGHGTSPRNVHNAFWLTDCFP